MKSHHHKKTIIDDENVPPLRLQALVDGVFAIAMTLLVFNIHVPEISPNASALGLLFQLSGTWTSIFSFIVSFIILGTFWVGHHTEFHYIKKLDHELIWYNIVYLLLVSFLPFTAALLGKYTHNATALVMYGLHLILMVFIHYLMWQHAISHKNLIIEDIDPRIHRLVDRLTFFAVGAYVVAIVMSFIWIPLTLIIYVLAPLPYIFGWIYQLV